ncbi:penicillin acylase family protein [Flavobacterium sp.]|uniref:penicillin acylase family protein n=1 Tax=Flavobacterium sp. TaxID=239 RepID=UPI0037512D35
MKIIKKTILVLISIIVLVALSIFIYTNYTKPKYEGEVAIKNISKTTNVYFDDFGIPHIYANSQKDAMTVLGYVHAQDRLWQMELMRRIAPGRLSELFGNKVSKTDMFFAGIGIEENSEKTISELDKNSESYKLTMAYLDGINQYLENGKTPIEFNLLGIKKQKFTIKDVYNIFGYMSFSFAMAQKTDPLMTDIRDKFGANYLKDFGLDGSLGTVQLISFDGKANNFSEISKQVSSLLDNSPIQPFIGSNSWVIGAQKTKNGKVIFANDPHIGFSQPCTWYEAHIVTPNYELYGYYLAGTPFPLLAHNRDYAYGLTMFENDDLDLFQEENNPTNPNQYKYKNEYLNYTFHKKIIKVKDSSDIVLNIKESIHGPIMNGIMNTISSPKPIAMSWIYTQQKNKILDAVYHLSHSKNLEDFHKNIELITAPGLNIMYGDAKNNIAWITSGKLYKVDKSVNPNFILNGSNGIDDKKEFINFSKNPAAINPNWNYVYSSNNQPQAIDNYLYPGYYLPKDRAQRIESFLVAKNNFTKQDVQKMMVDNTSNVNAKIAIQIIADLNTQNFTRIEKDAMYALAKWDGSNDVTNIESTIYNKLIYRYLENTFQDELGKEDFKALLSTHIIKQIIEPQTTNENSAWWDNIYTKNKKETRKEILQKSFQESVLALQNQFGNDIKSWTWNKAHTLEHQHPIGKVKLFEKFFNVGKFEVAGSNEVINNLMFTYSNSGLYEVKAGPSTRRIIDFSDIENSVSILPTGNSGNPMSSHYNDQAEMYVQGKFRKMKMNKAEIIKTSTKLVFVPN